MRVILINLPWKSGNRLGVRAGSRWPFTAVAQSEGTLSYIPFPFFLATAAALLKREKHEILLIDAIAEDLDEEQAIQKIKCFNPDLVVVETSTPSFANDIALVEEIRRNLLDSRIALCGSHATVFSEQILKSYLFVDYILKGEYEYTLLDLVSQLKNNLSLESVLGLAYRNGAGIRENPKRLAVRNLDALPWPERESLPIQYYNDGFCDLPMPNVQMMTSRGCPFSCTFCLWPQVMYGERRYRKRDPKNVAREMSYLIQRFKFKAVYFDDDVFNIDKNHVLGICHQIRKMNIKIPWAAMARPDLMDEESLGVMAESGLYAIKYGVESANKVILQGIKKNIDLDKTKRMIQATKAKGVKVHLTFCVGLPGETKESIQETKAFIEEVGPDSCQFSFATPFPGTDYFRHIERDGCLFSKNWSDYDGNTKCIVKTLALNVTDIEEAKRMLEAAFLKRVAYSINGLFSHP